MALPEGLEPIDPLTWRTIVARCLLGSAAKLVALAMANYSSPNGADVRPGVALLSKDTDLGQRTVREALAKLRRVGLVFRTFEASATGLRDMADEYQLTFPDDLESRVAMWDPKRRKITKGGAEQARPAPRTRRKRTEPPAGDAGGQPVDNSEPPATGAGGPVDNPLAPAGDAGGYPPETPPANHPKTGTEEGLPDGNHRQLMHEPPATDDRTTGISCRPPSHTPSHRPSHHANTSPYDADVEGNPAEGGRPPAERHSAGVLAALAQASGPDPAVYEDARDMLAQLPDLGGAHLAAARQALGDDASPSQIVIRAAALARGST
ncbi:hypothetical protein SAMN05421505_14910 [Sinosporangium album]|uniref:Helix-turn-helix domain-containing protein n=1 Tax=Sinosporangium album TaxID=504805 RepID=A0A1G8KAR3_9ACTN|nr:hypothetical protein [Sinosporangium album]SDI40535.1 hypothetical protein SAMN05421505_14910 [Sinosporangium album]